MEIGSFLFESERVDKAAFRFVQLFHQCWC